MQHNQHPLFFSKKFFIIRVGEKRHFSHPHQSWYVHHSFVSLSLSIFVAVLFQFFLRTTRISFRTIYQNPEALLKVVCGEIFREGKINFCICRACCIQSSLTSTRSHGLLSLSLSLSSNARRSSRTRSKKPRYFPSCFPAATGSTRREIPRKRRKQKRRRRRNSGGHSRLP